MPGQYVGVEDSQGHRVHVSPDGRLLTSEVPEDMLFYFHTVADAPGVVAANTFMSVLNPVGSGKLVVFFQAEIKSYSVGASLAASSIHAHRISAASGGTQIAAANVSRFVTTWANPVAEVRVGNPTITQVGLVLNAWPPPIAPTEATFGGGFSTSTPPGAGFVCLPGEGLAFFTNSGDVDQRWNITPIWAEQDI